MANDKTVGSNIAVASIYIDCDACTAPLSHPETGSHLWDTSEARFSAPFTVTCPDCGATVLVEIPFSLKRFV